jgi:4-amino-4-deoxy-L-arabinose transferase-like glycosyltransferase
VARVVMVALSTATVVLTAVIARELARNARAARIAGIAAALYVPAVLLIAQSYAQHLAALCLVAVALFGLRAVREKSLGSWVVAGAALGVGCLTRPSMASVAPVLAVLIAVALWRAKGDGHALARLGAGTAIGVAVCVGIIAPVQAHNASAGAGWTISTNNERNLFLGNNPYTPDYKTSHLGQRELGDLDAQTRAYLESFYERPDARLAMQHEALSFMASHPLVTAHRTLNRATSFWGFDYLASRIIEEDRGGGKKALAAMLLLEAGAYAVVMALAIASLFAFKQEQDAWWRGGLVAIALAYQAPYVVAFSGGTYHFPVMPLVIPFAAAVLANARSVRELWARVRASRATVIALVAFVAIQVQYAYWSLSMAG